MKKKLTTSTPPSRRWGRKATLLILLLVMLCWCAVKIRNPDTFPVKAVKIIDVHSRLDNETLRETILPFLNKGLLWLPTRELKSALLNLPWVKTVDVQRVWPGELIVTLTEQTPSAYWNQTDLLNTQGQLFKSEPLSPVLINELGLLPWLAGPDNQLDTVNTVWEQYEMLSHVLALDQLKIAVLELTPDQSWEIKLNNGIPLMLGSDNIVSRLKRFVAAYPKIFDNNLHAVDYIEYIDLRYNNGLAVKWKT